MADEQKRISLKEMAKLEPANASAGESIFFGHFGSAVVNILSKFLFDFVGKPGGARIADV